MEELPDSCPPLQLSHDNGDVTLSTFERTVSTVVEFLCSRDDDVIYGSPALRCLATGVWNGTVPRCINKDELANLTTTQHDVITTPTFDPASSSTTPGDGEPVGHQIETVVVLLWGVGGAMLVTLGILLVCILRSHKKARRQRSSTGPPRGSPRHGGANPGFSAYDEIWTWIPVVRDSQDRCPAQINPSARESSSNAERNLLSTLRLPSYNEAVRNNQNRQNNESRLNDINAGQRIPRPSVSNTTGIYPQTTVTSVSENQYDTIPADVMPARHNTHNRQQNITHVSVTSSSGAPVSARAASQSAHRIPQSRDNRTSIHSPGRSRGGDVYIAAEASRAQTGQHQNNPNMTSTLQLRHAPHPPQFLYGDSGDASEFIQSERSAFAHYRERTRRVNDVIQTEREELSAVSGNGGDPAVSLTRLPRVHTYGVAPSAPSESLDSVYF